MSWIIIAVVGDFYYSDSYSLRALRARYVLANWRLALVANFILGLYLNFSVASNGTLLSHTSSTATATLIGLEGGRNFERLAEFSRRRSSRIRRGHPECENVCCKTSFLLVCDILRGQRDRFGVQSCCTVLAPPPTVVGAQAIARKFLAVLTLFRGRLLFQRHCVRVGSGRAGFAPLWLPTR
eukprot:SAG31_NODE_12216_length_958_cov_1.045402_1_plen_182_part_00